MPETARAHRGPPGSSPPEELLGDGELPHPDHDPLEPSREEVPELGRLAGVDHRHVQKRPDLPPHDLEDEGHATCLGLEEVVVGRLLPVVLLLGEARPFQEVEDGRGRTLELFAGLAGDLQVRAPLLRIGIEVGLRVAPHEREIEGPPRPAQDRNPRQLALEEELGEGNAAVEHHLEDGDVHPGLVVAAHQIAAVAEEAFGTFHFPPGGLGGP